MKVKIMTVKFIDFNIKVKDRNDLIKELKNAGLLNEKDEEDEEKYEFKPEYDEVLDLSVVGNVYEKTGEKKTVTDENSDEEYEEDVYNELDGYYVKVRARTKEAAEKLRHLETDVDVGVVWA